jgi:hypothetical protein
MPRGAAAGVAAFALTTALACDNGGFDPTTWNLALVGVCALALVLVIAGAATRPARSAVAYLALLGALTAWTALSYFWSDSPPFAPLEAQRVALYFAIALTVVLSRRYVDGRWVAGGVAAGATVVAAWNLVVRIRGVAHPGDSGALAGPVGYANSLALLCVLGIVLLAALPRRSLVVLPVLAADLVLQTSTGALLALGAAACVYVILVRPRARIVVAAVVLACAVGAPFALNGNDRSDYWHVAVREAEANPAVGSGAGTFAAWWLRERSVPTSTREAHSFYLETFGELGALGLALALAVVAAPVAVAARSGRPVVAAAATAYAVGAAVDFHWELAGVTAPAILVASTAFPALRRRRSAAAAAPVLVALVAAGVLAYAGNARLASAQSALRAHDPARAVAQARDALRFAPYSAAAWEVVGDASASAAAYRRALALDPNDWSVWAKLAAVTKGESRRLAQHEAARLNPFG